MKMKICFKHKIVHARGHHQNQNNHLRLPPTRGQPSSGILMNGSELLLENKSQDPNADLTQKRGFITLVY